MKRVFVVAAGSMLALALGLATLAPADSGNKYPRGSDPRDCDPAVGDVDTGSDSIIFEGPKTLWPPNHKYVTVNITADGDTDTEGVSLTTTVVSSQPDNGLGDGNTTADADPFTDWDPDSLEDNPTATQPGSATTSHDLRSERAGNDPLGRSYTISATAKFDDGTQTCEETFTVTVPHDQSGGAGWKL